MAFDYKSGYQAYKRYYFEFGKLYKTRKEIRAYVNLGLAVLTLVLFIVFAIRPTLITISSLLAEIRSQEEVDRKLSEKVKSISLAFTNYSKIKNRLDILKESGPDLPIIVNFLRQMEAVAAEKDITIAALSFDGVNVTRDEGGVSEANLESTSGEPSVYKIAKFNLIAKGDYSQLDSFIMSLENLRRIVIVDSYLYSQDESGGAEGSLSINLTGGVLYSPLGVAVSIVDTSENLEQGGDKTLEGL